MNFLLQFQLFIWFSKCQDCMIQIENVLDSGLPLFDTVDEKLQLNHFKAAAKKICEISSDFAAKHFGPYVTNQKPKKCLTTAGGNCEHGGICPLDCGPDGYCCSKILTELNGNCPAGYLNKCYIKSHYNSDAVASISRILGRDHVCVARNKTYISQHNQIHVFEKSALPITTTQQTRMRNSLNYLYFFFVCHLNVEHPFSRQLRPYQL